MFLLGVPAVRKFLRFYDYASTLRFEKCFRRKTPLPWIGTHLLSTALIFCLLEPTFRSIYFQRERSLWRVFVDKIPGFSSRVFRIQYFTFPGFPSGFSIDLFFRRVPGSTVNFKIFSFFNAATVFQLII